MSRRRAAAEAKDLEVSAIVAELLATADNLSVNVVRLRRELRCLNAQCNDKDAT